MKHFIMGFFALVLLWVWMYILTNIFGLNLTRLEHEDGGWLYVLLTISPSICFFGTYLVYFTDDNPEETPKEIEPKTENLKTDNPEDNEIITVTEIQGVKKIIKNGKVIYCEQLKADELKVFEQLKDKKV